MKKNILLLSSLTVIACCRNAEKAIEKPNFLIIYTDDQRFDAVGENGNENIITPNMDKLFSQGVNFQQACVVTSICSPSRAAMLTGRYGTANGVLTVGHDTFREGEVFLPELMRAGGYSTAQVGKWHLGTYPSEVGFDYYRYINSNGSFYERDVFTNSGEVKMNKYIEEFIAENSIDLIDSLMQIGKPWLLWLCTQVPHMDHTFDWDVRNETLEKYKNVNFQVPDSWSDDLSTKPDYLKTNRSHLRAIDIYGYDDKDSLINHIKRYHAAVTEMDEQLGRVLDYIKEKGLDKNTYIIFMGDNGWFNGEHQFTSKVLAYEESVRVPSAVKGPGIKPVKNNELILNIDIAPTVLELAGLEIPPKMHGKSLKPILSGESKGLRDDIFYEAPVTQLGSYPLFAIRSNEWKYIQTYDNINQDSLIYQELYHLKTDPLEMNNLALKEDYSEKCKKFSVSLKEYRKKYKK